MALITDNAGIVIDKVGNEIEILLKNGGTIKTSINDNAKIGDTVFYTINYCNNPPTIKQVKKEEK